MGTKVKIHGNKKFNDFSVDGDVVTVVCRQGSFLCDLDDWERLKHYRWQIAPGRYAITNQGNPRLNKNLYFHKLVVPYKVVDHINRIKSDNRKINLREVSEDQNRMNTRGFGKSGYKGVSLETGYKDLWRVRIGPEPKTHYFRCKYQAALCFNILAKHYYGEFAYQNPVHFA